MVDIRLRTFGQNMDVCLSLLDRTHEDLSKETGISITKLIRLHTGEVMIGLAELKKIADELNIPAPHLTRGYPGRSRIDRLRLILEELGLGPSDAVFNPLAFEEPRLPPTIRRVPKPNVLIVGGDQARPITIPEGPRVIIMPPSTSDKEPLSLGLRVPDIPSKTQTQKPAKAKKSSSPKSLVVDEIDPAFVMSFDGVDYNLKDKDLKKAIVDRVRYQKGALSYNELASRLQKKRKYAWFINLGGITPAEVVDIAGICGTTAEALVTGKGIVPLAASEKASVWLERYIAATDNQGAPREVAHEILRNLEVLPAPLRHMIIMYIKEIM